MTCNLQSEDIRLCNSHSPLPISLCPRSMVCLNWATAARDGRPNIMSLDTMMEFVLVEYVLEACQFEPDPNA